MKKIITKKHTNNVLKKKSSIERKIEWDAITEGTELIGEIQTKGYEFLMLHRFKFVGNPLYNIHLRFWRIDADEQKHPTDRGFILSEHEFKKLIGHYIDKEGE